MGDLREDPEHGFLVRVLDLLDVLDIPADKRFGITALACCAAEVGADVVTPLICRLLVEAAPPAPSRPVPREWLSRNLEGEWRLNTGPLPPDLARFG